ncbi:putative holin-like toxin [Paenibacillus lautus]
MPVIEVKDVFLILFAFGSFLLALLTYLKKK